MSKISGTKREKKLFPLRLEELRKNKTGARIMIVVGIITIVLAIQIPLGVIFGIIMLMIGIIFHQKYKKEEIKLYLKYGK